MLLLHWNDPPEELAFFPALSAMSFHDFAATVIEYSRLYFSAYAGKQKMRRILLAAPAECRHFCKIFLNSISIVLQINVSSAPFFDYFFYLLPLIYVMGCGSYVRFPWSFSTPLPQVERINQTLK